MRQCNESSLKFAPCTWRLPARGHPPFSHLPNMGAWVPCLGWKQKGQTPVCSGHTQLRIWWSDRHTRRRIDPELVKARPYLSEGALLPRRPQPKQGYRFANVGSDLVLRVFCRTSVLGLDFYSQSYDLHFAHTKRKSGIPGKESVAR